MKPNFNHTPLLKRTVIAVCAAHAISPITVHGSAISLTFNDVDSIGDLRNAFNEIAEHSRGQHTINITGNILDISLDDPNQNGNAVRAVDSVVTVNGGGYTLSRSSASGTDPFRFFLVRGSGQLNLNNLTLENGFLNGYRGGAVFVDSNASLTTNNVSFSNNKIYNGTGGAIYSKGLVTISGGNITNNEANAASATLGKGAGLFSNNGTLILRNTRVSENSANGDGGGIHVDGGTLTMTNTEVTQNSNNSNYGGGIYVDNADVSIDKSSITNNLAAYGAEVGDGGGLFVKNSSGGTISASTISSNTAGSSGGGIGLRNSELTIVNTTLSKNSASRKGGGIFTYDTFGIDVISSTISGNSAPSGGGVYATSPITLSNSIIANSTGADCSNLVTADTDSIIEDGSCGTAALAVDPKLGPLSNNGGPTLTHALLAGSPAINMGLNSVCNAAPTLSLDQRGYLRTGVCDIGAYEFAASLPPPPPPFRPATIVPSITLLLNDDD